MYILMQDPECTQIAIDDLEVLKVDEECVCMSDFIKTKLGVAEFVNGHAFYEFKRTEYLDYYKEVIYMPEGMDKSNLKVYI